MKPTVSVIIPVYNAEETLDRCVSSVVSQSLKNIEIILIDDGSKDESSRLCDGWGLRDARVRVIHQENSGLALARKIGIQHANGKYVGFVDADDYVDVEMYESMLNLALKEGGADVICCRLKKKYSSGKVLYDYPDYGVLRMTGVEALIAMNRLDGFEPSLASKLIKKTLFDCVQFDASVTIGEDYRASVQLLLHSNQAISMPNAFYNYIQNPISMCYKGYAGNGHATLDSYTEVKNLQTNEGASTNPELEKSAVEYWILQEMAVVISMVKADVYDWGVVKRIQGDVRKSIKQYLISKAPLYLKICALLISICPQLLLISYKLFKRLVLDGKACKK